MSESSSSTSLRPARTRSCWRGRWAFALLFVFGVRVAAVFMFVVSTLGLRTGLLPRWLVIVGYVCGLVFLLTVTYVELLALLLPAWVTAVSVVILRGAGPARSHQRGSPATG